MAVGLRVHQKVAKQEREEHNRTHCPHRSWCKYCRRARGMNRWHRRLKKDEEEEKAKVPRIDIDYMFMSKEDEKAQKNPIIVMVDESTNDRYGRAVGQKGLGENGEMDWIIKDLSEELKTWGHAGGENGKILMKCDGERSIKAVRMALMRCHGGITIPEQPARGERESNGAVEESARLIQ